MLEDQSTIQAFDEAEPVEKEEVEREVEIVETIMDLESLDYSQYTSCIVACSGGKDSVVSTAWAMDRFDKKDIELWHHDVDGREGSKLMDWPVTRDYVRAFAEAMGLKLRYSWREGGIEAEMNRDNQPTGAIRYEDADGVLRRTGGKSKKLNTRLRFPQVSADLSIRWCSGYAKIDVMAAAIRDQHERFATGKTLIVTGERAAESSARAKYKTFEPHRTDNRGGKRRSRHIDHVRPIHGWSEAQVWDLMRERGIVPHPAYQAGFGRVSCCACIFANSNQLSTIALHAPHVTDAQVAYEQKFGTTIHRTKTLCQRIKEGTPYQAATAERMAACMSETYNGAILVDPSNWTMPAGAFGESAGPT